MKTIIYARVSTKEQAEEGYSLSSQVKLLKDYSEKRGFLTVKRFIVPESASGKQDRKTFLEMLEYLKQHPEIKIVLCEKVDRITRNFKDSVKLDDWINEDKERQMHFVKQNLIIHKDSKSHEKFQWDIYLVLAKQYSNNLSEETRKGLDEKAEQLWYPGNWKRGYKTIGEIGQKIWTIDISPESEAPFIKKAFELYDSGEYTTHTIGKKLFEEGWKNRAGKPIGKSAIHKLLKDCFYCGEFNWGNKHYSNAKHPALISKELFCRVQERIKRKITGKYKKHSFLLQGLIKCGECGRSIIGEIQRGHNYYHCTHFKTNCAQRKFTREEELEVQISGVFEKLQIKDKKIIEWIRKALKENHSEETEYHNNALTELNRQYALLQQRLDNLYDDKLDGKITGEFYDRKFQQYTRDQESILDATERHRRANISYFELGLNIFELSQKAKVIYENKAILEEKRSLLNFVFSNIFLRDGKLDFEYKNAFQLLAERSKTGNWLPGLDSNQDMILQGDLSYH